MHMVRCINIQDNEKGNVLQILECKNLQHQKAFLESIKVRNTIYRNLNMLFKNNSEKSTNWPVFKLEKRLSNIVYLRGKEITL